MGCRHAVPAVVAILGAALTGCTLSVEGGESCANGQCPVVEPDAAPPAASFRSTLTVVNGPAAALTDFPLRVHLDATRIDFAVTEPDGADVYFTGEGGAVLDHEIESWTPPTAELWLLVPSLRDQTRIDMHFGGGPANHGTTVWSDYRAVFHLDQTTDSSGKTYQIGDNGTQSVAGQIGRARGFASGFLDVGADLDLLEASSGITISAWVRRSPDPCNDDCTVFGASVGAGNQGSSRATLDLNTLGQPNIGVRDDDGLILSIGARAPAAIPTDQWTWLAGTADLAADRVVLYVNGEEAAVTAGAGLATPFDTSPSLQVAVGVDENLNGGAFLGDIDELRVRLEPMPAPWIATQFASVSDALLLFGEIVSP